MTYDHNSQYRATIVRSKSLTDLDDLLIVYAKIINEITPCSCINFPEQFNERLRSKIAHSTEKTIDNHRTEIAGKLFGMFFERDNTTYISERTLALLETGDQPAFFKDLCAKFQFPSGMNKPQTTLAMIKAGINVRQFAFFLKVLLLLEQKKIKIDRRQAGYYIFNSLDILTRKAKPEEVVTQIRLDINNRIYRKIESPGKATSFDMQHINEQINLLILANVIYLDGNYITLNLSEENYINSLSEKAVSEPEFDFHAMNMRDATGRKNVQNAWNIYFSEKSKLDSKLIETSISALSKKVSTTQLPSTTTSTKELGTEGEDYVYDYELKRVAKVSERLKNKVLNLGSIKGLGFDIQSVWASPEKPDSPIFIEVKSTKRVTAPTVFSDTISMTRNEWIAAESHGDNYFIYRVYFTASGNKIFAIQNPYKLHNEEELFVLPLSYRVDFRNTSGSFLDE